MNNFQPVAKTSGISFGAEQENKVLKNTYILLAATLLFSGVVAAISAALSLPYPGILITLVGYFGLLFMVHKTKDSAAGIASVFALTGFMGYTLGPMIGMYWAAAPQIVMQSLSGTALIFFGMSGYAMTSKRDFSFLGSMLTVGILVGFVAALAALFMDIPALSLAVSAIFVLLMSGLILYETSNIVRGGETNYILATVTLYVAVFNLFTSLMHLLGFFNSEE